MTRIRVAFLTSYIFSTNLSLLRILCLPPGHGTSGARRGGVIMDQIGNEVGYKIEDEIEVSFQKL